MLIVVLPSLQLLNIHNINSKSKDRDLHQSNVKADNAKTSQTRHVTKFKSKKRDLASNNEFQNMQNKNQATNTSVFLSNKASFKYQVDYSNYNTYGAKSSDFNVAVAKNTKNRIVSIGLNLISAITVKVSAPGQKWASLSLTNTFTPTKDMIPASIHYLIVGSKNINDAKISLNMIYEKRTDPMRPVTLKIGFFNVNNINENVGTALSDSAIGGIVFVGALSILVFGFSIFFLWERQAVKSATVDIRAIMALAKDDEALSDIKLGNPTYREGKLFTENFRSETDTMIKRTDRREIFGIVKRGTRQEETNIMIAARDKVEVARKQGVFTIEETRATLQELHEPNLPKSELRHQETIFRTLV